MKPKAVYWDMDGTLVDSEPLHDQALSAALESVGIEPPADLHERVLGQAARPVYDMMRRDLGLKLPFDDWIRRKYDFYLLQRAGVVQAVVSNSDRLIIDANLGAVGIVEPGMKTVSRNDVRQGKPHPEPFLRAAWLTEVDPAETFVMEDSVTGATAGLAAGMKTIFWPERPTAGPRDALHAETAEDVRRLLGLD